MSSTSKIEWTEATWNPVTGCTKVSAGCKNCYAERLAPKVFAGQKIGDMRGGPLRPRTFTDVLCHPERLDAPLHWKKPRRIFVNSMSDLFHKDVPDDFIDRVFAVMAIANWHAFQILTKRAERMLDYMHELYAGRMYEIAQKSLPGGWESFTTNAMQAFASELPNVWLGVSVEDQPTADERIPLLLQTLAALRFISYEPALGALDLVPHLQIGTRLNGIVKPDLSWVIAGGESGPKARPSHPDWFRDARDQCAAAGVPYFFKQWGEWGQYDEESAIDPPSYAIRFIAYDGRTFTRATIGAEGRLSTRTMVKVGKKAAGRALDGRIHDDYPVTP